MADLNLISEMLQKGKAKDVERLVGEALAEGVAVQDILAKGLISGMSVIGAKFKNNQIYVPEVLISARAMNKGMSVLEPAMVKAGLEPIGTVVMGTVRGDLHDIGKNLVCMMFKGAGFKVIDLGTDVPPEKFAAAAKENDAGLVGLSALLTTTMPTMKECVELVKTEALKAKVIIGGAPVTQAYSDEIGAAGYSPDAASAVELGKRLIGIDTGAP